MIKPKQPFFNFLIFLKRDVFTLISHSLFVFLLCVIPVNSYSDTLQIGGTGSSLGTMQQMADAYMKKYPDDTVIVLPSLGSGGGIKAVIKGIVGLSFSGRPLKEKETKLGLKQYLYAKTPFVIAVSENSPVTNLSLQQIENIYSGKTTEWPNKQHIKLVMRDERESDTKFLRSISPEIERAVNIGLKRKGMLFAVTDQESADLLQNSDGSIGTSTLTQIISEKLKLRAISVNGIEPTVENLQNESYTFHKDFRMIIPNDPSSAATRFVDFVFSDIGKTILKDNGCLLEGKTHR